MPNAHLYDYLWFYIHVGLSTCAIVAIRKKSVSQDYQRLDSSVTAQIFFQIYNFTSIIQIYWNNIGTCLEFWVTFFPCLGRAQNLFCHEEKR